MTVPRTPPRRSTRKSEIKRDDDLPESEVIALTRIATVVGRQGAARQADIRISAQTAPSATLDSTGADMSGIEAVGDS